MQIEDDKTKDMPHYNASKNQIYFMLLNEQYQCLSLLFKKSYVSWNEKELCIRRVLPFAEPLFKYLIVV